MNKDTRKIIKEINKNNNLETNLPQFANVLSSTYYEYAMIRFVLEYYTYNEIVAENTNNTESDFTHYLKEIKEIANSLKENQSDIDMNKEAIEKVAAIREQIIKKMKVLTTYADIFPIYEYVLNRLEYKFSDEFIEISDEEFTAEIMNYIFAEKDNVIVNERVKDVISQLPIRMTKNKFYDIINDSLSIYLNIDKSSVEDYIYTVRSSAMLEKPEGLEIYFENLCTFMKELKAVDYQNLNKEETFNLMDKLSKNAEHVTYLVESYVQIQGIINNLYVLLILNPYITKEMPQSISYCYKIIADIHNESSLEITKKHPLFEIEGIQESLFEQYTPMESALLEIYNQHMAIVDNCMLKDVYDGLFIAEKLLSSSIFIELDREYNNELADRDYIKQVSKKLTDEFAELFAGNSKLINRGIMSYSLRQLPIFFNTNEEIRSYILNSLEQCRNKAEKTACIHIIRQLIDDI